MFPEGLLILAKGLLFEARKKGLRIATAESCTGGLISALLTEFPGSSLVFERGYVAYSNRAKTAFLHVPPDLIAAKGAVSEEVARAMAEGALKRAAVDVTVAVTGIAGPDGGTAEKPVGLVHVAAARLGMETLHRECRFGDIGRSEVRLKTADAALRMLAQQIG